MKIVATKWLRWLYCLTLISSLLPLLVGMTGYVGLAVGGGMGGLPFAGILVLAVIALYVWRVVVVARHSSTLDSFVTSTRLKLLRGLGIVLMLLGVVGSVALLFVKPLTLALLGKPGDAGIGYFVVSLGLYFLGSAGMFGLALFEMSRLFGFEAKQRDS